jgi:hypothetical protein
LQPSAKEELPPLASQASEATWSHSFPGAVSSWPAARPPPRRRSLGALTARCSIHLSGVTFEIGLILAELFRSAVRRQGPFWAMQRHGYVCDNVSDQRIIFQRHPPHDVELAHVVTAIRRRTFVRHQDDPIDGKRQQLSLLRQRRVLPPLHDFVDVATGAPMIWIRQRSR